MIPSEGTELKRRKKVNVNVISIVQVLDSDIIIMPLVGAPIELDTSIQWETCDNIMPINYCITDQLIPMEPAAPLDWSSDFDVHF